MEQTPPPSMPSVIKEEPRAGSSNRRQRTSSKSATQAAQEASSSPSSAATKREQPAAAAAASDNTQHRSQHSESRFRRSMAPTLASSRALHPPAPPPPPQPLPRHASPGTETVGASDVRLQEIRQLPSPEPAGGGHDDFTDSFVSNGLPLKDIDEKFTAFNNVLGDLQHLGIQQHVANLPELILVGDQSAGKSSLMSAIAGLSLPRSGGTCTRCPIHIRLQKRNRWSCQVRLQIDYAYQPPEPGVEITTEHVNDANPFPPWVKKTREVQEFMSIEDKNDTGAIERALSWAQMAILNPSTDYKRFIPISGDYARNMPVNTADAVMEAKFSPNVIALEIQGPGLADLSFYDLPGLIVNTSDGEDEYLIKVVENLTREYIDHPGAIIIWAVPMTADPQTSSTFTVIRRANALNRCIGVMTKADLLARNNHKQWLEMLEGKKHRIRLGYFITSRYTVNGSASGPANLEHEHKLEEAFFNRLSGEGPAWPEVFGPFDNRCGVERLKRYLIKLLSKAFRRSLPAVKKTLKKRLRYVDASLRRLPELPSNPEALVRTNLTKFADHLTRSMQSQEFAGQWARLADAFRDMIIFMKPKYRLQVGTVPRAAANNDRDGSADVEIISVHSSSLNSPSARVKRQMSVDQYGENTPQRRRGPNGQGVKVEDSPLRFPITPSRGAGNGLLLLNNTPRQRNAAAAQAAAAAGRPGARSMTLEEVRQLIHECRKPGMPNTVPDEVKVRLCMNAVCYWQQPLHTFLSDSIALLRETTTRILSSSFSALHNRQVFKRSRAIVGELITAQRAELQAQLDRVFRMESRQLYTLDEETCGRHELAERRILMHTRHHYRYHAHLGTPMDEPGAPKPAVWAALTEEQRAQEEARMNKEAAKLGRDPYQTELEVAAYVRGYYLTAAWRFIDSASLHFTSGLIPDIAPLINKSLEAELGISDQTDEATWKSLMEEDSAVAAKRDKFQSERAKFSDALDKISQLEVEFSSGAGSAGGIGLGSDQDLEDDDDMDGDENNDDDDDDDDDDDVGDGLGDEGMMDVDLTPRGGGHAGGNGHGHGNNGNANANGNGNNGIDHVSIVDLSMSDAE